MPGYGPGKVLTMMRAGASGNAWNAGRIAAACEAVQEEDLPAAEMANGVAVLATLCHGPGPLDMIAPL